MGKQSVLLGLILVSFLHGAIGFANGRDVGLTYRAIVRSVPGASENIRVRAIDASTNLPIEAATVLIGESEGAPFAGNIATTDGAGEIEFRAPALAENASLMVTAAKAGYQALTVTHVRGRELEIFLTPDPRLEAFHFLRGRFTEWPTGIPRTDLELGLFVPAFRASTMLNFDLAQIVSSYKEEIRVLGQKVMVPGNFVLPRQSKVYNYIPVTLDKPVFAMPLAEDMQTHMAGIVGDAPLGPVVDQVMNKDFLGAVNRVKFTRLNWTEWKTVTGETEFDIHTSRRLAPESLASFHSDVPAALDLVAFALVDPTGEGRALVPMDIKAKPRESRDLLDRVGDIFSSQSPVMLGAREFKLTSLAEEAPNSKAYVFSAVLDQKQFSERSAANMTFSAALSPVTIENGRKVARTGTYLHRITLKSVSADRREFAFEFDGTSGPQPDYFALNLVATSQDPARGTEARRLVWTALLPPNARTVRLPALPGRDLSAEARADEKMSWEVIAIRRELAESVGLWDSLVTIGNLKQLSHATQAIP